jgi:Uma2 family endonuclease
MPEHALKPMTVDEFLVCDDGTDIRHELADGVIRAMSPPAGPRAAITANSIALVHAALRARRPCRPLAEAGIRIDEHTMWQADVAVTCKPTARETPEPLLVVEVLSPSTRIHDLGRKLNDYKSLASIVEIWMVDSERRWTQLWRRDGERWIGQDFVGNALFESAVLAMPTELDEIYADSGVEQASKFT